MYRKISTLLLVVTVMTIAMTVSTFAQGAYAFSNNSAVPVTVAFQIFCPGPPASSYSTTPVTVPRMVGMLLPIPPPPCQVIYVIINGSYYLIGYTGPPLNPPSWLIWINVTPTITDVW